MPHNNSEIISDFYTCLIVCYRAEAICESCIDGPKLRASPHKPIVMRAVCPFSSCEDVTYSWSVEVVPRFSKQQPNQRQYWCRVRDEQNFTTTTATTPVTCTY